MLGRLSMVSSSSMPALLGARENDFSELDLESSKEELLLSFRSVLSAMMCEDDER